MGEASTGAVGGDPRPEDDEAVHARVRAALARHGYAPRVLKVLGAGLDHVALEADARLVVRVARGPGGAGEMAREARFLRRLAAVSPLPVPEPELLDDGAGGALLVHPRLPGTPLLHVPADRRRLAGVGRALGGLLAILHAQPVERWADVVDVDDAPLEAWRQDAADAYATAVGSVPLAHRPRVEAFLHARPPAPTDRRVLCHGDLGSEHVLIDGVVVTGVLDWSDAAVTDPARDLGLVYRDLGRTGLRAAAGAYGPAAREDGLLERVAFFARCGALEDLAYGLATGRAAYARKSLASLGRLFAPARPG